MKKILLAIFILAVGITLFCAARQATAAASENLAAQTSAWQTQTQQLVALRLEQQRVLERVTDTKQLLKSQPSPPTLAQLTEKILSGASLKNLSATESEQLLAELGFNWNSSGEFLIVSKKSLVGISFDGMNGVKLTAAAIGTLAISPAEQGAVEAMTQQLCAERTAWVKEHIQRTEPSGDVLAEYTLPANVELSQSQLAVFTNGVLTALGSERGQWLQDHSSRWMEDTGLHTGYDFSKVPAELLPLLSVDEHQNQPTTLTLKRYQAGKDWHLNFTLQQAGNNMTTSVNPWQPFPEAFQSIFPGGWRELAEREGFELPKEFKKQ